LGKEEKDATSRRRRHPKREGTNTTVLNRKEINSLTTKFKVSNLGWTNLNCISTEEANLFSVLKFFHFHYNPQAWMLVVVQTFEKAISSCFAMMDVNKNHKIVKQKGGDEKLKLVNELKIISALNDLFEL